MKKILIIDDDVTLRDVLRIYLILEGYSVFTAPNGEEGLGLFNQVNPHLVICDYNMPDMDGIEVLRRILIKTPDAQVILLTGSLDVNRTEAKCLGAVDLLAKPVSRKILCGTISNVLNNCQSHMHVVAAGTLES